ncbi:Signal transduction histidine kinase [Lachnospiraceae bacterium]|nr:Signal transduction histidine kinase [Lachnospiraceae bacterium]
MKQKKVMKHFSKRLNNLINMFVLTMACILTCLFVVNPLKIYAEGISDEYMQTIYDQESGLGSSEINCIYQTESGYIWIGTDSGLYRYNGSEFKLFNLWDTDKEDVYYINSLYQDSNGTLWVGTNNYGLFNINGTNVNHFSDDYYNGIKTINDICQSSDGIIYVATAYGLYYFDGQSENLIRVEPLAKKNIQGITFANSHIWGIYNGNTLFSMDKNGKIKESTTENLTTEELTSISSDSNSRIFLGTVGNDIISFSGWNSFQILHSSFTGINDIYSVNGNVYVCTDNGIGYFKNDNTFIGISGLEINNYITSMIVDYEGNFWFASKRSGILYMSKSKFSYFNKKYKLEDKAANCIYKFRNNTYIGTDDGLLIIDSNNANISNEVTDYLNGISIRDIKADSKGNIWIATYRRYGVIKISPNNKITPFSKSKGLISNLINCLYIMNDDSVAVGTEEGMSIISPEGDIASNYNYNSGLDYPNILCFCQDNDDTLYAGSDGGGLYTIKNDKITTYSEKDGLTSNVVASLLYTEKGLWIGTNNGLSFYNGTFRAISNVDFSNNISSILNNNDDIYIIGSKGVLFTSEDELLGTAPLKERYLSTGDGINSIITANSHCIMDENGLIYICTEKGVLTLDPKNIYINTIPPKINVTDVDIDGTIIHYSDAGDSISIPSDTQRVEIDFGVLSYSNRENIKVTYQLIGFDNEPQVLSGNDNLQAVYTNLDGGNYIFIVSATNGDNTASDNTLSFTINKKDGFFENKIIRALFIFLIILIVLVAVGTTINLRNKFLGKNKELEDLSKEHEDAIKSNTAKTDYLANMSNEIKLPINAMISKANSMIKDGSVDKDTADELKTIIQKGEDVLYKVDETILLARLESGAEELLNEPYSITTLICDISDNMLNKLSDMPIKFVVDLGENIPDILIGDFDKIKTTLGIILENALKYTKEGSITLSVDCYEFSVTDDAMPENSVNMIFSISDTGTGISPERLEHIFELYYVDESKKTVMSTGNGISLSIAKKLAQLQNGDIEVESTDGAGSTFTVSVLQKKYDESGAVIPLNENTIERVSREEAERMWAPDLRILLVDDVDISRNVAMDVMSALDIRVDTAASGLSAIDMVMNHDYDMVFMDIVMPVMNGIDALKEIRDLSDDKYRTLPVIAMSEDAIGKNRQDLINEGFSDVVLKPFDITVFAGLVVRFADKEKIKYKSNDVTQYISDSRYSEGLKKLEDFFDVVTTLEKIGGSIDVYNRILSTFYNQNKDAINDLDFRFNNDYRGFRNKIHNIRTGCQNIGAVEASEIALRIESAVNTGNKSYVKDNLYLMKDCLSVITDYIKEYLEFVNTVKGISDVEYAEMAKKGNITDKEESADTSAEETFAAEDISDIQEFDDNDYSINETASVIIDIDTLRSMREATYLEDMSLIKKLYKEICTKEYGAEDIDFLNVLGESIEKKDFVEINDLLGTYISLKSSL